MTKKGLLAVLFSFQYQKALINNALFAKMHK